jgi:hypothetical protein
MDSTLQSFLIAFKPFLHINPSLKTTLEALIYAIEMHSEDVFAHTSFLLSQPQTNIAHVMRLTFIRWNSLPLHSEIKSNEINTLFPILEHPLLTREVTLLIVSTYTIQDMFKVLYSLDVGHLNVLPITLLICNAFLVHIFFL